MKNSIFALFLWGCTADLCVDVEPCSAIENCARCRKCQNSDVPTFACLDERADMIENDALQPPDLLIEKPLIDAPLVPGGTFYRSYDGSISYPDKRYPATISPFRLDKYEVTVGRFRKFVEAVGQGWYPSPGDGAHPRLEGSGWDPTRDLDRTRMPNLLTCDKKFSTWTASPGANETRAINCVGWLEAFAFCIWDGGRLPTEAEWNFAAAGGDEQRAFPYGNYTPTEDEAIYGRRDGGPHHVGTTPLGLGRWGHFDLAGNVWEWTLDIYAPYENPCTDCAKLTGGSDRVLRGGNWSGGGDTLRVGARPHAPPTTRDNSAGVRCARD